MWTLLTPCRAFYRKEPVIWPFLKDPQKIHILVMPRDHPQSYLCLNLGSPPPLPRHYLAGLARTAECCGEKLGSEPHPPMCYRGLNYQNAVRILADSLNRYHDIPPHVKTSQCKEWHWSEQHRDCHSLQGLAL